MVDEQRVEHGLTIARVYDGRVVVEAWPRSLRRGVALGLALSLHLGLLLTLLLPPSAMRSLFARSAKRDHAIDVRLIDNPSAPQVSSNPLPPATRQLPQPSVRTQTRTSRQPVPRRPATPPAHVSHPVQTLRQAPPTAPSGVPAYIPGGGFMQRLQQARRGHAAPALPGSGRPIAAGVRMVDPRSQGAAGLVRAIGGFFGAENPACVDVDAWQRMTPRQLGARGLNANDVQQVADQNGCLRQKPIIPNHIDHHPGGPTH